MTCAKCGAEFDGNYCPSCGSSILPKKCPRCATETTGSFCPQCGYSYDAPGQAAPPPPQNAYQAPPIIINNSNTNTNGGYMRGGVSIKSKWIAFILCLFLGYFGVHRFYVGNVGNADWKVGQSILQLARPSAASRQRRLESQAKHTAIGKAFCRESATLTRKLGKACCNWQGLLPRVGNATKNFLCNGFSTKISASKMVLIFVYNICCAL